MFRNPRENVKRPAGDSLLPSTGRPPSPPTTPEDSPKSRASKQTTQMTERLPTLGTHVVRQTQVKSTIAARGGAAKTPNGKATPAKKLGPSSRDKPNGSILTFFKKEDQGLFVGESLNGAERNADGAQSTVWDEDELYSSPNKSRHFSSAADEAENSRFNENAGPVKRMRLGESSASDEDAQAEPVRECIPSLPESQAKEIDSAQNTAASMSVCVPKHRTAGPFVDDSDSETEPIAIPTRRSSAQVRPPSDMVTVTETRAVPIKLEQSKDPSAMEPVEASAVPPLLKREATSYSNVGDFEDFDGMADFDDDEFPVEGEEYRERQFMAEQRRIELAEAGLDGAVDGFEDFPDEDLLALSRGDSNAQESSEEAPACPICSASLSGISAEEASVHVNNCLDGNPTPLPERKPAPPPDAETKTVRPGPRFTRPVRPPKPGQDNPIQLDAAPGQLGGSAFSKLMSGHAEDAAWASAAASEHASRGKPAFTRTCPFYKIMPGMFICVDAFRYGGVKDCRAYFLSHFHSDHYIGLTSTWSHGPIYGSRVTNNLIRQQLRVDPKYVIDLEFEKKTEVPGTRGVFVTMIPANHCPGSSLFLFEKVVGKGPSPKVQRILHCGDFRACEMHLEHPLLKPEVVDSITGQTKKQSIDICYLDTTYLNPKYAFPSQEAVIRACGEMCVSLNKVRADDSDGWETMKRERAGEGMVKFVQKDAKVKQEPNEEEEIVEQKPDPSLLDAMALPSGPSKPRGKLLVVVGTYSIGKERICKGIAKALDSKIYAPPSKMRICACLEDPELNARLTNDPRAAQVHMTPLFEIRADTLDDYLKDYRDTFSRAVGFRPTGWNYRPPNSRFVESPAVSTVLRSSNWKSGYSMKELVPQRGSTSRASCFGVPYSEHSSFRELTMFCCALRIEKVVPTVNVGSAKSRERMRSWVERWMTERRKNGLFRLSEPGNEW